MVADRCGRIKGRFSDLYQTQITRNRPRALSGTWLDHPERFGGHSESDPRLIKASFRDAWAIADSRGAFVNALEERGYKASRGDRRGFVALNRHGEYLHRRQMGRRQNQTSP